MKSDPIDSCVDNVLNELYRRFKDNDLLIVRHLDMEEGHPVASLAYLSAIVDEKSLNRELVGTLSDDLQHAKGRKDAFYAELMNRLGTAKLLPQMEEVVRFIVNAGIVLFVEGRIEAYGIVLPGYETRAVEEPKIEVNVRGPREGFTEELQKNLGMVYRRLKTPDLKSVPFHIGQQSQTKVTVLYLENRVDEAVLAEVKTRLNAVQLNVLIDSAQLEEWIQDSKYSPLPQIMNTERPDRVVAALNHGKTAILTDGTPNALIAPSSFIDFLHSSEDLYERFYFANFLRILRVITLFISLLGPSLYIALTTFHMEMIPTPLMLAFLSTKAGIPFPTFIEALIMEIAFEVLREASLRLPRVLGQSVSIVGALIIGETAVDSGIVSRPMVIVVAMTGIASFTIPQFSTAISLRMLRFPLMFVAASTGVFGLALGVFTILVHLCSLKTFGKHYIPLFDGKGWRNVLERYILFPIQHRNIQTSGTGRQDDEAR
ncbi:spore germination protein [Paenibacillus filicis]|uniref:Spore germination protein n=1 Tax=Paenibacillus gyeongsangnamensis TaxID=3388067 RepID=A0ABT4QEI6_9BACL|nr:spore germination protein [Paenibacillus filicis]MCZ8515292.1 spore germination protein [Paenibacillus filicis]